MREIKFRAWDKVNKVMIVVYVLDQTINGGNGKTHYPKSKGHHATGIPHQVTFNIDDVELMQLTGRKDKNGKDIYDGDRVRRMKDGIEGEVFWKYDGWFIKVDGSIDARLHDWEYYCESIEVIGTIYDEI